jgi:hypothetical protein
MVSRFFVLAIAALVLLVPASARAQETKSPDLAKQLAQLLDQKKLDSLATKDAHDAGTYHALLYFPGTQLLVVSAKYSAPALLDELLARKDFRGVYVELSSASVPGSKMFVMDTYANGLTLKPSGDQPADSLERGGTQSTFDGGWKKAKISEADYMKTFNDADAAYARVLQLLINQIKGSGT